MRRLFEYFRPEQASEQAGVIDNLFQALGIFSALVTAVAVGLVLYFCACYRAGRVDRVGRKATTGARKQHHVELTAIALALLVFLGFFVWSAHAYVGLFRGGDEAMRIYVVGKQWMWKAEHANGRGEINELHVPVGVDVELVMSSQDVIHSFFVPAFRIKRDVVPGRYTTLPFRATRAGRYHLFCAELCGDEHSEMVGEIVVLPEREFQEWLEGGAADPSLSARGRDLYNRLGCRGCHEEGSVAQAPQLDGLLGRSVSLQSGQVVTANRAYLRDSIVHPQKQLVTGYQPLMPSYGPQLTNEEVNALVEYLAQRGGAAE